MVLTGKILSPWWEFFVCKAVYFGFGGFDFTTEKDNLWQKKKDKKEKEIKKGCFVIEFGLKKIAVYITLFIGWNHRGIGLRRVLRTA